eukprot:Platyproteum_vivax@DN1471_c0_g1_i1.p1
MSIHFQKKHSSSTLLSQSLGKSTLISLNLILRKTPQTDWRIRKTKIVCTMGPSCWEVDKLVEMIDAGMNVARLNFSHGDHESHGRTVKNLIEASKKRMGSAVAVLLDTKGPEIRTGKLEGGKAVEIVQGQDLKIVTNYDFVGNNEAIACSYPKLTEAVNIGSTVLVADGSLSLTVKEVGTDFVICEAMCTAMIGEKKNMNLPNVKIDLPCISEKDKNDILNFGVPNGCNMIAVSFVQSGDDIRNLRKLLGPRGRHIKIIPKIENVEGLMNFDDILSESDGVMVARGDLGMEIPPEKVFLAQKMMIAKCNVAGKPVITATQMLESMTKNPRPTRAECTDVANAVLDGTDCVMLSGETAGGEFPIDAVATMAKICCEAEACIDYSMLLSALHLAVTRPVPTPEAVACAAVETAVDLGASMILVLTETGYTARLIAKYRPAQQVLSLSASESTVKSLQLHRGIIAIQVASFQGTDHVIRQALETAKEMELIQSGDAVVAVHGMREEISGSTNLLKVVEAA